MLLIILLEGQAPTIREGRRSRIVMRPQEGRSGRSRRGGQAAGEGKQRNGKKTVCIHGPFAGRDEVDGFQLLCRTPSLSPAQKGQAWLYRTGEDPPEEYTDEEEKH